MDSSASAVSLTVTTQPQKASSDLTISDIPPELRLEIYRNVLVDAFTIDLRGIADSNTPSNSSASAFKPAKTALFYVSSQVSIEALDVFYGENDFDICVCDSIIADLQHLGEANAARIRRLFIYFSNRDLDFREIAFDTYLPHPQCADEQLWAPIVSNLTFLGIYVGMYGPEGSLAWDTWAKYVEDLFKIFACRAPDHVETHELYGVEWMVYDLRPLIKEYFPQALSWFVDPDAEDSDASDDSGDDGYEEADQEAEPTEDSASEHECDSELDFEYDEDSEEEEDFEPGEELESEEASPSEQESESED